MDKDLIHPSGYISVETANAQAEAEMESTDEVDRN